MCSDFRLKLDGQALGGGELMSLRISHAEVFCASSHTSTTFRCGRTADPSTPAGNSGPPELRMTIQYVRVCDHGPRLLNLDQLHVKHQHSVGS